MIMGPLYFTASDLGTEQFLRKAEVTFSLQVQKQEYNNTFTLFNTHNLMSIKNYNETSDDEIKYLTDDSIMLFKN